MSVARDLRMQELDTSQLPDEQRNGAAAQQQPTADDAQLADAVNNPSIIRTDEPMRADRSPQTSAQVDALLMRISVLADDAVSKKLPVEERWLSDLETFHGKYDDTTENNLNKSNRSRLFVNQTRPRSNGWAARIGDMMFPTDDNNWAISPTPVPIYRRQIKELDQKAAQAADAATQANQQGDAMGEAAAVNAGQKHADASKQHSDDMDAVQQACELMSKEIEDQLKACFYNIKSREIIMDSTKLGTGILKGPMRAHRTRRGWGQPKEPNPAGSGSKWELQSVKDPRPEFLRVDPWSFFPDPNATKPSEFEYTSERHLLSDRDLRSWATLPDMDPEVIRQIMRDKQYAALPNYLDRLRRLTADRKNGQAQVPQEHRYTAWEYHGYATIEELAALSKFTADATMLSQLNDDPLAAVPVLIWYCNNKLMKWAPHPMDSGDTLYSVYNFERDETSCFGFGVPYLMRDSQSATNAAWRMIMNNAALASGPQIIIDKDQITPQNNSWDIEPLKVWLKKTSSLPQAANQKPFEIVQVEIRQEQLQAIIQLAMEFSDDETSMPKMAMGESGDKVTRTAQGMAILMNSVNVIFRRAVKNFDDQQTIPNIQRLYDWNMQFNKKEEIKGDYDVDAKGSSVLLVRELEAQNLMSIAAKFANDPTFGPMTKAANLYRHLIRAHMLRADDIVKSDDDIDQAMKAQADAQKNNPEVLKLQQQLAIAQMNAKNEMDMLEVKREIAMIELSTSSNVSLAEIQADLDKAKADREQKDTHFAAELAVHAKTGESVASGMPA